MMIEDWMQYKSNERYAAIKTPLAINKTHTIDDYIKMFLSLTVLMRSAPLYVGLPSVFSMGTTSLMLSLFIHILLLPLFTLLFFVIRFIPQLAAPYHHFFARNHLASLPDSPFLSHDIIPPDPRKSSLCDIVLPVSKYTWELGLVECVFCLCDIDEGEEIRDLACKHLFHRACLDRWLEFGRATCPICRDCILPSEINAKPAEMDDENIIESAIDFVAAFVHNGWWG